MELPVPEAVQRACALLAADSRQAYVVGGGIREPDPRNCPDGLGPGH